jgi:hypothetical protein
LAVASPSAVAAKSSAPRDESTPHASNPPKTQTALLGAYKKEGEKKGKKLGEAKALRRGIALALELKFDKMSRSVLPLVRATDDLTVLRAVLAAIRTAKSLDRIRQLLGDN